MNDNPIDALAALVRGHRCFSHPVFDHWAAADPEPEVLGALFHQIQMFCASTRPGLALPAALEALGMDAPSRLLQEIVDSEADHGPELATMAAHIINRRAGAAMFADLNDQDAIETGLKIDSDRLFGALPDYDHERGLTPQARAAIAVMQRRAAADRDATLRNLGTTVALEIISNGHLIPGEKRCLVDSGLYGVTLREPEMHYLLEHFGECGAEQLHERNALAAVDSVLDVETAPLVFAGARDFLEALAALWDVLDAALLAAGSAVRTREASAPG